MAPRPQYLFDVLFDDKPVLILGHKAPEENDHTGRVDANRLIRERMDDLRYQSSSLDFVGTVLTNCL